MGKKITYYSLINIEKFNADYNLIIGERSNGKTYACLYKGLEDYFNYGKEFAYIRRWDDDIKGDRGGTIFNSLVANGVIKKLSKGKYDDVKYKGRSYYLVHHDENGNEVLMEKPFAYAFAISMGEHYKSNSYPYVKNIIFDEFLTRGAYLPNEFVLFQNLLSTIIRLADDVKIYMLGNTVNKYAPYFREMGLNKIDKLDKGNIDLYTYGDSGLRVAVEYADFDSKNKKSNKYFAFDNPRLQMITNGGWEIDLYPHYPKYYTPPKPKEILYKFFVVFENNILEGDVIEKPDEIYKDGVNDKEIELPSVRFLFIHPKTTPIKDNETAIIYSQEVNALPNYRKKITKPVSKVEKRIVNFFARDKVFYADNETGEIMRNYIAWCDN